jgi:hypothetical protein
LNIKCFLCLHFNVFIITAQIKAYMLFSKFMVVKKYGQLPLDYEYFL